MSDLVTRPATPDDLAAFAVQATDDLTAIAVLDGDATVALGRIERLGPSTEPETPQIVLHGPCPDDMIVTLVSAAREAGLTRLMAGSDPMDIRTITRLEKAGFRPTGTGAYFELGGGLVEWVSGYTDATGSRVDLVWTAPTG